MEEHLSGDLTAAVLRRRFFLSRNNLYRIFRESFGCTPAAYITERRLEKAKTLLAETKEPVYSVCERVGIHNYTYFCNLFRNKTGVTPTGYRKDRQGGSR
jgi:AraC-like DNA-binding protein